MRHGIHRSLAVALAAALGLACASARSSGGRSCENADDRVTQVLGRALDRYVAGSTGAAPGSADAAVDEQAARTRLDAWSEQHRREFVSSCRGWTRDRYTCVLGAQSAQALAACGLGDVVRSFETEVLPNVAPPSPVLVPPRPPSQ